MPTNNDFDLTSCFITWNGHKIDNITSCNLVAEEFEVEPLTFTSSKDIEFSGEFTLNYPRKYNKKTRRFYRYFLGIDLLEKKFPKKKRRRQKRLSRKAIEWMVNLW